MALMPRRACLLTILLEIEYTAGDMVFMIGAGSGRLSETPTTEPETQ